LPVVAERVEPPPMTTHEPDRRRDPARNESEETVELFAGEGPVEDPGAVEYEDDGTSAPVSDTDAQPPL